MKMYRICRGTTFSGGGDHNVKFTKRGKLWTRLSHIKLHLNQFVGRWAREQTPYKLGDEVIEYNLVEVRRIPIEDFMKGPTCQRRIVDVPES